MATRKAKDVETGEELLYDDENESSDESERTPAEQDYELTLNNWLADLGGDITAQISVYRYDATNKLSFVDSLGANEMEGVTLFKLLKEEYGGGKFRIQLRAGGRIVKTQTLQIEPPPKAKATANAPLGNDLPALIRELKADNGNDTHMILQMMNQQNQQFQQMITTLVSSMGNNNAPPPISMTEVIAAVASLKDMSAPPPTTDPTELILKGIELATALRGDNDGGDANMYTLLQSAVKELGGTIASASKIMPNMIAPQPGQPGQPTKSFAITADDTVRPREPIEGDKPTPEIETKSRNPIPEQLVPFEPYVNSLVQMAAANKDPELYAEVIIDQLGEEYAYAWVGAKEGREMLMQIFTQAQPFAEWFETIGEIIAEILQGEDGEGIDEGENPPHNAGDKATLQPDTSRGYADSNVPNPRHDDASDGSPASNALSDGDSERSGRDTANLTLDGATGEPIQNAPED